MKIMLIQPTSGAKLSDLAYRHELLALEHLGAGLKADGHEVKLLDARLEPAIKAVCLHRSIRKPRIRHPSFSVLTPLPGSRLFAEHSDAMRQGDQMGI